MIVQCGGDTYCAASNVRLLLGQSSHKLTDMRNPGPEPEVAKQHGGYWCYDMRDAIRIWRRHDEDTVRAFAATLLGDPVVQSFLAGHTEPGTPTGIWASGPGSESYPSTLHNDAVLGLGLDLTWSRRPGASRNDWLVVVNDRKLLLDFLKQVAEPMKHAQEQR